MQSFVKVRADLHVHTNYSPDSKATMRQYVEQALVSGIDIVCFTDHLELNKFVSTYDGFPFEQRTKEFLQLKQEYKGQIKLLLGVEFGEPHLHPKEFEHISSMGLDMIIGSVHYALNYSIFEFKHQFAKQYADIYNHYVYDMLSYGGFDVLGHIDVMKRYYPQYVADVAMQQKCMEMCVKQGIVPEINTSTMSMSKDPMPSLSLIGYYKQCGGKYVTINSDSHIPANLGTHFDEVYNNLPHQIECCYFENRQLHTLNSFNTDK